MNDNLPKVDIPEQSTLSDKLLAAIEAAREEVKSRVGYDVEVARLEPMEHNGQVNLRVYWRRKRTELRVLH